MFIPSGDPTDRAKERVFVPMKGSKGCSCVAIIASLFILEIITSAHTANHSIQIAQLSQFHILGQIKKNDRKN